MAAAKAAQSEMYSALLARRQTLMADFEKKAARYKEILVKEMVSPLLVRTNVPQAQGLFGESPHMHVQLHYLGQQLQRKHQILDNFPLIIFLYIHSTTDIPEEVYGLYMPYYGCANWQNR